MYSSQVECKIAIVSSEAEADDLMCPRSSAQAIFEHESIQVSVVVCKSEVGVFGGDSFEACEFEEVILDLNIHFFELTAEI